MSAEIGAWNTNFRLSSNIFASEVSIALAEVILRRQNGQCVKTLFLLLLTAYFKLCLTHFKGSDKVLVTAYIKGSRS